LKVKADAGYDVDRYTAGNNYSQDVLNRMRWFQQEGFDQFINPPPGFASAGQMITVNTGRRYQATVTLSWLEQHSPPTRRSPASSPSSVSAMSAFTGDGATRVATGVWNEPERTVPLDSHLSNVIDLGKVVVATS
jgi:hypothetical protein